MVSIPTLTTKRLTLRPPTASDFPAYEQFMTSPRAAFIMGGSHDTASAWGLFCHDVACWTLFGHGALMVDLRATDACVGQVSISHGPLFPEKELGWLLYEGAEGCGYATEAAAALRDWAGNVLGQRHLVSYIENTNVTSIRVAERLGALRDASAPRPDAADLVYRHTSPI